MKRGTLITAIIIVTCFIAGIFVSEYIRSNNQVVNLPPALQINTEDLTGKPSPDFSLMDVSGQLRNVAEWQGKVLVINFLFTWTFRALS